MPIAPAPVNTNDQPEMAERYSKFCSQLCIRYQAMGVAMMGYHGYKGGEGFAVTDYANGNLTHTIKNRSMFDESLDKQSRLNVYAMSASQPTEIQRLMLQEAEVDEETIDAIVAQTEEQEEKDMEMAARGMASGLRGNAGDDDSDKKPTREEQAKKQADKINKANQSATNA